jgi:hypothetical protein
VHHVSRSFRYPPLRYARIFARRILPTHANALCNSWYVRQRTDRAGGR